MTVSQDFDFNTVVKGFKNHISYMDNEKNVDCFASEESKTTVEFNGIRSELIIKQLS